MNVVICCDFDGTITLADTGKILLTNLTDKDWHYYDELVIKGEMGTREALVIQWGMIEKATTEEINKIVDGIEIDPSFIKFFGWIKKVGIEFLILSDGFKTYINRILKNHKIQIAEKDIRSNDMRLVGGKFKLKFLTPECEHNCANCKYSQVKQFKDKGNKIIYIGDGLSDIFPARELADIIFAKENEDLARELKNDSRLITFNNFSDIKEIISHDLKL
ncbi:MAG: MtnX-like HAD-IB family phosphatase [Candidatus Thorarchaeota archaeon]